LIPTLIEIDGIQVRMYFNDHNPPHVHVIAGGNAAKLAISDGTVFAGSVSPRAERRARAWIFENQDFLFAKWEEFHE
tara:strand:- start:14 stop:244 length:231 start_codon:yes stop_codon:yes gene_type:complete